MPIECECVCGKRFQVRDELAGRTGKCKACGRPLEIPDAPPEADDLRWNQLDSSDAYVAEVMAPPPRPAPVVDVAPVPSQPAPSPVPRGPGVLLHLGRTYHGAPLRWIEPWYYPMLGFCGKAVATLGGIGAGLILIFSLPTFTEKSTIAEVAAVIALSVATAIGSMLLGSAVLVGLDAARHIRVLRQRPVVQPGDQPVAASIA